MPFGRRPNVCLSVQPSKVALDQLPIVWSMRLWPTSPLEFASPFGKSGDVESSSSRALSMVEAHRKTMRARNSIVCFVTASITATPRALPVFASQITRVTTLFGRSVMSPVFRAAGSVAFTEEKYDRVMQPRSQGPQ